MRGYMSERSSLQNRLFYMGQSPWAKFEDLRSKTGMNLGEWKSALFLPPPRDTHPIPSHRWLSVSNCGKCINNEDNGGEGWKGLSLSSAQFSFGLQLLLQPPLCHKTLLRKQTDCKETLSIQPRAENSIKLSNIHGFNWRDISPA